MACQEVTCRICGQKVYRDERGKIMIHTKGQYAVAEICEGWERGAKPNSAASTRRYR